MSLGRIRNWVVGLALVLPLAASANGRFIVKYKDVEHGKAALAAAGGKIVKDLGPQKASAALLPEQALTALRNNPHIEFVEEDAVRKPLSQTTPYGITMVQAKTAQSTYAVDGANRKVCIIDSGIYTGHEDHQGNALSGYPAGWNTDKCGHGTHVAGTIAAINNSVGVEGVLPNGANLYMVKVFGDDCAWAYASDLVDAANRCSAAGAHIISMSLGGGRKSRLEQNAFDSLWSQGVLSIAAAGNDGTSTLSYPASYASVVSVAAVDSSGNVADFSQYNSQVELAAPGVAVESTIPWTETNTLSAGGSTWSGGHIEFAARGNASGNLVDGGLCDSVGSWGGKVVLCQRGTISFYDKVHNAELGGAVGVAIYNNAAGGFLGTLGDGYSSTIPAISLSDTDGAAALAQVGQTATVTSFQTLPDSGYEAWDGTSMATPHVSGVAALVWSYNPSWTNQQIRDALDATAVDLGAAGRDVYYGYGLVQAKAALDYLTQGAPPPPPPPSSGIALSGSGYKSKGNKYVDLTWSGAGTSTVDVYRDGTLVRTTANDGADTDGPLGKGAGSYTYRVCEAGTSTCSADVTVIF